MKINGLTLNEFIEIVQRVSEQTYEGNVVVHQDAHDAGNNRCVARIRVKDSSGTGSRRSVSQRRMPSACWHAYRDVIHAVLDSYPDAKIDTGLEKYHGMSEFLRLFPGTADKNIGSEFQPAFMPDLCECGNAIAWPSWL
ncbi:MAG TPA: hypothetical protein VFL72_05735 [Acidimicrobiia bacterium]|nr:hypothetical protein [Acidimicrobiia bacterium]